MKIVSVVYEKTSAIIQSLDTARKVGVFRMLKRHREVFTMVVENTNVIAEKSFKIMYGLELQR